MTFADALLWGAIPFVLSKVYFGLRKGEYNYYESDDYDGDLAKIKERLNRVRSPFRSAEYFEIEEIIDPRDTRPNLCRWANLAYGALKPVPASFTYRP